MAPPCCAWAPTAQATRLLGDIVMVFAAWFHSRIGIAVGLATVLSAWTYGILLSHLAKPTALAPQSTQLVNALTALQPLR